MPGHPLAYDRDEVYPPAEDTFLLLAAAQAEARPQDSVLEIGCGSGLISRELAGRVRRLAATDINPHALRAAKAAMAGEAPEGPGASEVDFVRADLFFGIKGRYDLVLFNAPYLPTEPEERTGRWIDRALDGGASGREGVDRFLADLAGHLNPEGRALLLISSLTGLPEVLESAATACLEAQVVASERCFFEQLHVLRLTVAHDLSIKSI
ncbi:MAG TPA: methyltransferase [Methanothrix sp.]|nr:methyltransferase [Methanothrix sp.]